MADLLVRTARTVIERAIVDQLRFAFQVRQPAVANLAALRAVASLPTQYDAIRFVTDQAVCYKFDRFSLAADDGLNTIQPTDVASGKPGRWLRTTSTVQAGYAKTVRLYNGEQTEEAILERVFGQRPSFMVVWTGAEHRTQSLKPGALYWYVSRFDIWCISQSLRAQYQAIEGSDVAAEVANDPGVNAMIGDIKANLAGSNLSTTGVDRTELGSEARIVNQLEQRIFVDKLAITVYASVHLPDTDLVTLDGVREFDVQYQLATGTGKDSTTPIDCVTSGLTVSTQTTSLTQTIAAGSAYVGASLVNVAAQVHSFDANTYTYRDLTSDGRWIFSVIPPGFNAPPVAAGALRVGVTATDGSRVTGDRVLASSQINYP